MRIKSIFLIVVAFVMMAMVSCDDKVVTIDQLPAPAQSYLTENYPDQKVLIIKKDIEGLSTRYEVTLESGMKVEFDGDGSLRDVDVD
jgi:hypothetical protein